MNIKDEGANYLKQYPKLNKWINRCVCCGNVGYNPELPKTLTSSDGQGEYTTAAAKNIRKFFSPLYVNEMGVCETCQKFFNK